MRSWQSISEIARAAQQEKEDAEMVRRCLPARIDALLPQEMALCFEHELWQMLLASTRESRRDSWTVASAALRGAVRCLWEALQGFEARLAARGHVALPEGEGGRPVALQDQRRKELQGQFSGDLAELLATALPHIAQVAVDAHAVAEEAQKHLNCVLEAWEAVLTCKTQITDLYMDNDELSNRRFEDLVLDAARILEEQEVVLEDCDWQCVRDFLLGASTCPEVKESWDAILKRLQADFCKSRGKDHDSSWTKLAESVLEELEGVSRKEGTAAAQIQRLWRRHKNRRQPLRPRCANAHEMCLSPFRSGKEKLGFRTRRSSMFTRRSARWSQPGLECHRTSLVSSRSPEALSIYLLSEGARVLSSGPTIEAVTQFHRYCTALDLVSTVELSSTAFLAFWMNIRNLAVVVALLQLYTQPEVKLPNTQEEWTSCLASTSLFVHGRPLGPAEIDHNVLGCQSFLPMPSRGSLLSLQDTGPAKQVKAFMPWPIFGLWLPIHFGSPALAVFHSETLLEELRSSAEDFLGRCRSPADGYDGSEQHLRLPPSLRSSIALWQPLLKSRGPFTMEASVEEPLDWTFNAKALKLSDGAEVDRS
ncbi:unnamed protein product [Durusdinium trenchii]